MKEEYDRETAILYEQWEENYAQHNLSEKAEVERKLEGIYHYLWEKCPICGFQSKTYDQAKTHFITEHSKKYGKDFDSFLKHYKRYTQKLVDRIDKETEKRLQKDFDAEMFQKALTEDVSQRDDLSNMTIVLAKKAYEELNHEWDEQLRCSQCKLSVPFVKKMNDSTGEIEEWDNSVREHINTQIRLGDTAHTELAKYYNKMRALSEGKNPYTESEQLSKDTPIKEDADTALMKSSTESSELHKEELSESKEDKIPYLVKVFSKEMKEKLSKKKKHKLARKTR